jgi:hypothetical protein
MSHNPVSMTPLGKSLFIPPTSEVLEPETIPTPRKKPLISLVEAQAAAKGAGWSIINASALRDASTLGKFIGQCGAVDLGRGRLAIAAERIDQIHDLADQLLDSAGQDPQIHLGLIKVKGELVARETEIAKQLIASEPPHLPEQPERRLPGFGTNIQVNVSSPAATVQAGETPASDNVAPA